MRFAHTNVIARDWRKLSEFYQLVFHCEKEPPERDLKGEVIDRLTGMKGAHIVGEHLRLPGYGEGGPTLEIFSYDEMAQGAKAINACGFAHIAFEVDNVRAVVDRLISVGGSLVGEVVEREYPGGVIGTLAYCKDIEDNIIEIQSWKRP